MIHVLLALLLLTTWRPTVAELRCPLGKTFADIDDCRQHYTCHNGSITAVQCKRHHHYDNTNGECLQEATCIMTPALTIENERCHLPFQFLGRTYYSCTADYDAMNQLWCSLVPQYSTRNYRYCNISRKATNHAGELQTDCGRLFHKDWGELHNDPSSKTQFCSAIFRRYLQTSVYQFEVKVHQQTLGAISGIMYNIRDNQSYDLIILRLNNRTHCIQKAYVANNVIHMQDVIGHVNCRRGVNPSSKWNAISLHVSNDNPVVFMLNGYIISSAIVPHYKPIGWVGILLLNEVKAIVKYKELRLEKSIYDQVGEVQGQGHGVQGSNSQQTRRPAGLQTTTTHHQTATTTSNKHSDGEPHQHEHTTREIPGGQASNKYNGDVHATTTDNILGIPSGGKAETLGEHDDAIRGKLYPAGQPWNGDLHAMTTGNTLLPSDVKGWPLGPRQHEDTMREELYPGGQPWDQYNNDGDWADPSNEFWNQHTNASSLQNMTTGIDRDSNEKAQNTSEHDRNGIGGKLFDIVGNTLGLVDKLGGAISWLHICLAIVVALLLLTSVVFMVRKLRPNSERKAGQPSRTVKPKKKENAKTKPKKSKATKNTRRTKRI